MRGKRVFFHSALLVVASLTPSSLETNFQHGDPRPLPDTAEAAEDKILGSNGGVAFLKVIDSLSGIYVLIVYASST